MTAGWHRLLARQAGLIACQASLTACQVDLTACQVDLTACQVDLTACQAGQTACKTVLTACLTGGLDCLSAGRAALLTVHGLPDRSCAIGCPAYNSLSLSTRSIRLPTYGSSQDRQPLGMMV